MTVDLLIFILADVVEIKIYVFFVGYLVVGTFL